MSALEESPAITGGPFDTTGSQGRNIVRSLALTTFVLWIGAAALLPLLPVYVRRDGGSTTVVGAVMAAFFAASVVFQYPAGWLTDRIGGRPVLLAGLGCYALGSLGFLLGWPPAADIALRGFQGAGAGAVEVAAFSMVSAAVPMHRRGRAASRIFGGQLAGMAIGPLGGSLAGVGAMGFLFVAASAAAVLASLPVLLGARSRLLGARSRLLSRPRVQASAPEALALDRSGDSKVGLHLRGNRGLVGLLVAALCTGVLAGIYEACWTLLLTSRGAHQWEIGLSWTLFALPFIGLSVPGGRLADRADRRWLIIGSLAWSAAFMATYPFLGRVTFLIGLGMFESVGWAVGAPATQSLLSQVARPEERGRAQGLFGSSQTGATAAAAASAGALFGLDPWVPFVAGAASVAVLGGILPLIWAHVPGRAHAQPAVASQAANQ